jgi:hypothetical protein
VKFSPSSSNKQLSFLFERAGTSRCIPKDRVGLFRSSCPSEFGPNALRIITFLSRHPLFSMCFSLCDSLHAIRI